MDKIILYSPLKNLISQTVLDNKFGDPASFKDPKKFYKKDTYKNNNIYININSFGTTITTNPTIYLKGNNLEQVNNTELKVFIGQFENYLEFNSNSFDLVGLHFNRNIYTKYKPKSYLALFRNLPQYDPPILHRGKTGKTFKNNCKEFLIYDKKIEMRKEKVIIPESYFDKNVLRFELQINKKFRQTTKNLQNIKTLKDITELNNYNNIIKEFLNMYNKIEKHPIDLRIRNLEKAIPPSMDIQDEFILYAINELGLEECLIKIQNKVNLDLLSPKQGRTRKEKALSIWNEFINYSDNDKYDLLTEINTKVNDSAMALME